MSISILILLMLVGFICHWKKFKKIGYAFYLATIFLIIAVGSGFLPKYLLPQQTVYSAMPPINWGNNNVIILLGNGMQKISNSNQFEPPIFAYGRIIKTMEVYRGCKKTREHCTVLISGGDPKKQGNSEAAVYGEVLKQLGLPTHDLILESNSNNTWQNADFSSAIIRKMKADKVILVTSGFHMKRSLLYFSHFGNRPIPVRADYVKPLTALIPQAYNFLITDLALAEQIGIIRYDVYNFFGWNKAPVPFKS